MSDKYMARDDAPIEPETWKAMDAAVVETARSILVGRKMLHIDGPVRLRIEIGAAGGPATARGRVRQFVDTGGGR